MDCATRCCRDKLDLGARFVRDWRPGCRNRARLLLIHNASFLPPPFQARQEWLHCACEFHTSPLPRQVTVTAVRLRLLHTHPGRRRVWLADAKTGDRSASSFSLFFFYPRMPLCLCLSSVCAVKETRPRYVQIGLGVMFLVIALVAGLFAFVGVGSLAWEGVPPQLSCSVRHFRFSVSQLDTSGVRFRPAPMVAPWWQGQVWPQGYAPRSAQRKHYPKNGL